MEENVQSAGNSKRLGRRGVAALAVAAVVIGAVVAFLVVGGDGKLEPGTPKELSADDLKDVAGEDGPVYWAGTMEGTKLEVTKTARGHVFVRYLNELAPIGDNKPQYTTVATYSQANALGAVRKASRNRGMASRNVTGGGLAIWSRKRATSVYVGLPNSNRLVEVFNPDAQTARDLAISGRIQPVS